MHIATRRTLRSPRSGIPSHLKKQNNYFLVAGCPDSLRVEILGVDEGVDI